MAPNNFSKEEIVAFDQLLEGFHDQLVLSKNVSVYKTNAQTMERANNTIWRPQPYIMQAYDGTDMTANFQSATQLSVPVQINRNKSIPYLISATELNDALQEKRLSDSASQMLASQINIAIMSSASYYGSLVVKRTTAASGYDDVAQCEAIMNEQGVPSWERSIALSTRDYNGMANNLSTASRSFGNKKSDTAYERSFVGMVASFDTFKLDYADRLTAAAGTSVVVNGANQYYVPAATQTGSGGEQSNVDNRFMDLAITVGGGTVKVGDCFTIAGVNAVHHITKQDTGQLKTFRIVNIVSGAGGTGTVTITPPIISGQGGSDAELQYQNVTDTPAASAAITFLNTTAAYMNPFWQKDALELIPGNFVVPENAGAQVLRATTDQGMGVTMMKYFDIDTRNIKYRVDCFFGVANKQPEMSGIILFSQS